MVENQNLDVHQCYRNVVAIPLTIMNSFRFIPLHFPFWDTLPGRIKAHHLTLQLTTSMIWSHSDLGTKKESLPVPNYIITLSYYLSAVAKYLALISEIRIFSLSWDLAAMTIKNKILKFVKYHVTYSQTLIIILNSCWIEYKIFSVFWMYVWLASTLSCQSMNHHSWEPWGTNVFSVFPPLFN